MSILQVTVGAVFLLAVLAVVYLSAHEKQSRSYSSAVSNATVGFVYVALVSGIALLLVSASGAVYTSMGW